MDTNFGEVDHRNFVDPFYGMSAKMIHGNDDEEMVTLLGDPVELHDEQRQEINGNDCLDALNLIQMFNDMKGKYYKTLKTVDFLKCELLTAKNCISALEIEVKDLKGCKENLEIKLQQLNFKKALEDIESAISYDNLSLSNDEHLGHGHKFVKSYYNSNYMQSQKEKEAQHINAASENIKKWLGIHSKSLGTQTDIADDLNEISPLITLLNEVTSKYCIEKAMLERKLMHIANEKELESSKLLREREIRQKCLNKMEKLKEERDAAVAEYHLVMSERDVVHKEINQLQDQLTEMTSKFQEAQKRIEYLEGSQRVEIGIGAEEEKVMSEFDQVLEESQIGEDAIEQSAPSLYGSRGNPGSIDSGDHLAAASAWMQNYLKENNSLKRQIQQTINEFAKRDRMVRERDSMRIMCDQLRQDRDNTVSELIKAKKQSDELKKQRNQALNELKALQEVFRGDQTIPCSRDADELISRGHSKDSAIDSDFQEWETELINLDIGLDEVGDLGFELTGGCKEGRSGQHVYVKNILSSSPAHGIIQTNDQIVQVNEVDVSRADVSLVCQLIKQGPMPVNLLIKRKKSCSKLSQNASLQLLGNASSQRNSKHDLPPLPPATIQGGSLASRQQLKKTMATSTEKIVSPTTIHYHRPIVDESGFNGNSGSQVRQRKDIINEGNESNYEHSKTKKNILNKAFMALAKPFRNIPRDVRSRSSMHNASGREEVPSAIPSWESNHFPHRETWPKCRNVQSANGGGKKSRPRLNLDFAFQNVGNVSSNEEGKIKETTGQEQDVVQAADASTKNLKTSFVYHYVQMSDPLSLVSNLKDDSCKEEPSHCTGFSERDQKNVKEEGNVRTETFLDLYNEREQSNECKTSCLSSLVTSAPNKSGDINVSHDTSLIMDDIPNETSENNQMETKKSFHKSPIRLSDPLVHFSQDAQYQKEADIWHHPPTHQFLRAVEERVSGMVPDQRHLKARNQDSCPYHHGTVGKTRNIYPASAPNFYHYEGMTGTKTLPHMNSHFNNSRKLIDASIFCAQDNNPTRRNYPITLRGPPSNLNYGDDKAPGIFMDAVPSSSYPAYPRVEKHHVFNTYPIVSITSQPYASSSIITLNSGMLNKEGSIYNNPYQEYISSSSSSKSDAVLLDAKQKLCRHLKMDYAHLNQHEHTQKQFEAYRQRHFNILDSNSAAAPLRNVQMTYDSSVPSMIKGIKSPANHLSWCSNKTSQAQSVAPYDSGQTGPILCPINSSQPNFFNESDNVPNFNSFLNLNKTFMGYNVIKAVKKSRNVICNPATTPQRNSEPVNFIREPLDGGMQFSSISDNGLMLNDVFRDADPINEPVEVTSKDFLKVEDADFSRERPVDVSHSTSNNSQYHGFVSPNLPLVVEDAKESLCQDFDRVMSSGIKHSDAALTEKIVRSIVAEKRLLESLKVNIVGGNTVGIFVGEILEGSILDGPQGLRVGDRILEFNGTSLNSMLLEEAVLEINKPCEKVTCQVQYAMEDYKKIQNHPCDSLYVRALFDQTSAGSGELSFSKGDVLFVDNTYFNNRLGMWWGYLINKEGQRTKCGTIISRMNRHLEGGGYFLDWKSAENSAVSGGSIRRSFFKRRKPQATSIREEGYLSSMELSFAEVDLPPGIPDDESFGLYERIEKLDTNLSRPVLIVGPFANQIIAKLAKDFPFKFYKFIPEFGRKKSDSGSISYSTETGGIASIPIGLLKNSMIAHHHSLLNFPVDLVPKFMVHKIHFIVILIKFKSYKQIKESRDSNYMAERVSAKHAREMLEASSGIERKFKHLIAEVVPGGCLEMMCSAIVEAIEREQNKQIWLPASL